MSKLKANVDDLSHATEMLKDCSDELEQAKKELQEIQTFVNTEWEGVAAEAYKALLKSYMKELVGIKDAVKELKEYADHVGIQMKALDEILDIINKITIIPIF